MPKKPKVEEAIEMKKYVYKFDISPLWNEKTSLNIIIIW
jgi:hypothetical protein